jgi:hypothetical protein
MTKEKKEVLDFYSIMPKSLQPKYENPNYDNHLISIPFFMAIIGQTGSKKTNLLCDLIHKFNDTFGQITIICKDNSEPLYAYLRSKIDDEDQLRIIEGIENTPRMEELDPDVQHLMVWDDMCIESARKHQLVEEYFIRSRKVAKGVSCIYISQVFFKIPKSIRLQCSYCILKKLSNMRDLKVVLADFNLNLEPETLLSLYVECTREPDDFLLIDSKAPPEKRFRYNYKNIIDISQLK